LLPDACNHVQAELAISITGDIPAMWLRDSTAQVLPYLHLAPKDSKPQCLFQGFIHRQAGFIRLDA